MSELSKEELEAWNPPWTRSLEKCKMYVNHLVKRNAVAGVGEATDESRHETGGWHLFEIHMASFGSGLGLIVMLMVVCVSAVALWKFCLKKGGDGIVGQASALQDIVPMGGNGNGRRSGRHQNNNGRF